MPSAPDVAAIANQWALDKIIDEMREITKKLILKTPESTPISRRKNLMQNSRILFW